MKTSLLLASLAAGVFALPGDTYNVHHKRDPVRSAQFQKRGDVAADAKIPFEIALKQRNLQEAEDILYDISNPSSPNYGKHLSKEEVVKLFASDDESIASVKRWLVSHGVDEKAIRVNPTKTWISVDTTASILERALKTKYHVYRSANSGNDHIGAEEYSLPSSLSDVVDFVRPGPDMVKLNTRREPNFTPAAIKEPFRKLTGDNLKSVEAALADAAKAGPNGKPNLSICGTAMTPQCIAALYQIPPATLANITNPLGIFESLGDIYDQPDLDGFFKAAAPYIPAGTGPTLDLIDGATAPTSPSNAGDESLLDFEMAYPIIYPQTTTLFQVQPDANYDIFGEFLSAIDSTYCSQDEYHNNHEMCGNFQPTNVVSISYGGPEDVADPKGSIRQCNEFMKLGLIGVTVVVASGDAGVTDRNGYCQGPYNNIFVADDLCSCPYITGVGSTLVTAINQPEVATEDFSSGGGFSNIFLRPSFQDEAVGNYLLRHNPGYFAYNTSNGVIPTTGGIYNRGGRGFPDVAAVGDNGLVYIGGGLGLIGGTSMAAPIVASILNRINEERLNVGKGPIGFANPALYAMGNTQYTPGNNPTGTFFNDITYGNQSLGGVFSDRGYSACGNDGFSCVPGWDPVTGFGTPIYPQWLNYFLNI